MQEGELEPSSWKLVLVELPPIAHDVDAGIAKYIYCSDNVFSIPEKA